MASDTEKRTVEETPSSFRSFVWEYFVVIFTLIILHIESKEIVNKQTTVGYLNGNTFM